MKSTLGSISASGRTVRGSGNSAPLQGGREHSDAVLIRVQNGSATEQANVAVSPPEPHTKSLFDTDGHLTLLATDFPLGSRTAASLVFPRCHGLCLRTFFADYPSSG